MKRAIFTAVVLTAIAILRVSAQEYSFPGPDESSYSYNDELPRSKYWKPETKTVQRYSVAVHPFHLINNGFRVDFEYELKVPGEWIQIGVLGYAAPHRNPRLFEYRDNNLRATFNSSFDCYDQMWGVGVAAIYKKMWHRRGWYFSTGLLLEYFDVGRTNLGYVPYEEEGLRFYARDTYLQKYSFVKPTIQMNIGKHFAFGKRVFMDIYMGISASYSIYDRDKFKELDYDYKNGYYYGRTYGGMYGFARRGINIFNCGIRFGVLFWNKQ